MLSFIITTGKGPSGSSLLNVGSMFSSEPITLGQTLTVSIYKFDVCIACHNPRRMEGERKMNNRLSEIPACFAILHPAQFSLHLPIPPSV